MRLLAPLVFTAAFGAACALLFLRSGSTAPLPSAAPLATPLSFASPTPALAATDAPAPLASAAVSPTVSYASAEFSNSLVLAAPAEVPRAASAPSSPAAPVTRLSSAFAPLRTAPSDTIPVPAVLAPYPSRLDLTPEQRAVVELLAADFADAVGDPGSDKPTVDSPFAERVRVATSEADFIFRQRYGHHAWVQLQIQTTHQLNGY